MRIAFDDDYVVEIVSISATPCWPSESEIYSQSNPEHYSICFETTGEEGFECEYVGEYLLDGSRRTYLKAIKNFKKVCKKLLKRGYCSILDFKNAEFY